MQIYFKFTKPRDNFAPRAFWCMLLDFQPELKGYKLFDLASKTIFCSKDVIFHEHTFLGQSHVFSHSASLPFSTPISLS